MDVMAARRRLMMQAAKPNTSPKIAEDGCNWTRTFGAKVDNIDWCITDWYYFEPIIEDIVTIVGYIGDDNTTITMQYTGANGYQDYFYFNKGNQPGERNLTNANRLVDKISFSIQKSILDDSYVYVKQSGQILFAGKNTIYYGHRNISELS